jgi:hypothetical protein
MKDDPLAGAVAAHGSDKNRLVVLLSEYEGRRIVDLRRWYTDAKTGAWAPTKKGVALAHDAFAFVSAALLDNEARIRDWLSHEDEDTDEVSGRRILRESQARASQAASYAKRPFDVRTSEWNGPEFFRVEGNGGSDILVLNLRHPASQSLVKDPALGAAIAPYLVSFSRAQRLADGGSSGAAAEMLGLMVSNWSLILRQYLSEPRR